MRFAQSFAAGAAFLIASASQAWAGPVTLSPVSFSPEFRAQLDDELGAREGAHLSRAVERALATALSEEGAVVSQVAPLVIDVTIVDAKPNRPTIEQLASRPGLDFGRSISIGGADLRAVLRTPDGQVVREVSYSRFDPGLTQLTGAETTWSSAQRSIRRFADKVADAYADSAR